MKCDEPLFQDGSDYSSYDCVLELRHTGAHEDARGRKYPRAVGLGLDEDINDLIADRHPTHALWDLDEREYPIVVETVTRYVLWVSAPSEDDALAYYADDPTDISLNGEVVIDGSIEVQRMDRFDFPEALATRHHGEKVGPKLQCPDCKALSFTRTTIHNPYRRCHGPITITWRPWPSGKGAFRDYVATPMPERKPEAA
ncbi:hypothetical protein [Streptomyces monomycini]|uniref:hypothetical protein n=1 Tax=Streptomyces monomycini TaxID=371720 RepID=UPI0004AA28F5|nr:hypothetical protein [Streptomyces monomycini]